MGIEIERDNEKDGEREKEKMKKKMRERERGGMVEEKVTVSLFNGISTFVGYLMLKPSF